MGSEVNGHRLVLPTYDATDTIRVVRDPVLEDELLDDWLGLRTERTTGKMAPLGWDSFCHLFSVCTLEAAGSTRNRKP